jgi:hypothetical protein
MISQGTKKKETEKTVFEKMNSLLWMSPELYGEINIGKANSSEAKVAPYPAHPEAKKEKPEHKSKEYGHRNQDKIAKG